MFGGAAGVASALTRNMGMVADGLVYDETYQRKQKMTQQTQAESVKAVRGHHRAAPAMRPPATTVTTATTSQSRATKDPPLPSLLLYAPTS